MNAENLDILALPCCDMIRQLKSAGDQILDHTLPSFSTLRSEHQINQEPRTVANQ